MHSRHLYFNLLVLIGLGTFAGADRPAMSLTQGLSDTGPPELEALTEAEPLNGIGTRVPLVEELDQSATGKPFEVIEGVPVDIRPEPANSWQVTNHFDDFDFKEKYLTCIDSDSHGNLWVAVSNGLYFYDGYEWEKFGTESGLPTDFVRSVLVSRDGTVWVGTAAGAGRFQQGRFEPLECDLAGPSVRRIVEDREGAIWFCCDQWPQASFQGGLTRYFEGQTKTWTQADGLPSNYVSDFFEDSQGRRFVLTNVGLAEFNDDGFQLPLVEAGVWQGDTYVWSMVESKQHGLLVATTSNLYQFKNDTWRRIPSSRKNHGAPKMVVTKDDAVLSMNNGHRGLLLQFDGQQWQPIGRAINGIRGGTQMLHEDAGGAIWIIGFQRILRWDRRNPRWDMFRSLGPPVAKDHFDGIWFSSFNKGLVRFHQDKWYQYNLTQPAVFEDIYGQVWVQSQRSIYQLASDRQLKLVTLAPGTSGARFLGVDREQALWLYRRQSLSKFKLLCLKDEQWHESTLDCNPHEKLTRVCLDPDSGLWVVVAAADSTPSKLIHVQFNQQREIKFPVEGARLTSLPSVLVRSKNHVLLGDFYGLFETRDGGKNWHRLETPAGFVSRLFEVTGNLWVVFRGHAGGEANTVVMVDGQFQSIPGLSGDVVRTSRLSPHIYFEDFGQIDRLDPDQPRIPRPPIVTPYDSKTESIYTLDHRTYWIGTAGTAYKYSEPVSPIRAVVGSYNKSIQEKEQVLLPVSIRQRFLPKSANGSFFVSSQVDDQAWTDYRVLGTGVLIRDLPKGRHDVNLRILETSGRVTELPGPISIEVLPIPIQLRPWFRPVLMGILGIILLTSMVAIVNWRRARTLAIDLKREVVRKTGSLNESEGKYRLLFQESQDAILLTDSDAKIFRSNEAAAELFGLEGPDHNLKDYILRPEITKQIVEVLAAGDGIENCRLEMRGRNGRGITALMSIKRMQSLGEKEASFQIIVRDTSDLMRLENRIAESEKLQALGRLAGGIAHDFNNFLAIILFGADLIEVHAQKDPLIEQGLQSIIGGVERGKALVAQIQSYNRAASQNPGSMDPGQLLRKFPVVAGKILPDNIDLVIEDSSAGSQISVEENQLEQVLINLSVNASHAMPNGGAIRIKTTQISGEDVPKMLELDQSRSYVLLEIEDDGCGMDAELRAKIFDPFFTTKAAGQGTGLGLAIVYGIVKQCGGAIDVKSTPDVGTLFQIYLPESSEGPLEPQFEAGHRTRSHSGRILVVDDEPQLRRLIEMSLKNYGYSVSSADSGEEALKFLNAGDDYDLVISDILMTGMTGLELVDRLKQEKPNLPTLLVSGYPQSDKDDSLQDVCTPILMKPFRPIELVDKVEEVLGANV